MAPKEKNRYFINNEDLSEEKIVSGNNLCEYRALETKFCMGTDEFLLWGLERAGLQASEVLDNLIHLEGNGFLGLHLGKSPEGGRVHPHCFDRMVNLINGRMQKFTKCLSEKELWGLAVTRVSGSHEENPHVQNCEFCWRHVSELERVLRSYAEIRHIRYS